MRKGKEGSAAGWTSSVQRASQRSWLAFMARGSLREARFSRILGTAFGDEGEVGY